MAQTAASIPPSPAEKLSLSALERHLWGAADILRGKIDSSDYKHYIFGLLFYKRICDVWEEEYEQRLAEYNDSELAADPDEHRFHIPPGAFWSDTRKVAVGIGDALNQAFHAIEDANPRLLGVFQDVDFNNKERFPDETLELLLQHFEKYRLRNVDVSADVLGDAYQYLIKQFADDAGKKGGEFYTPEQVVRLIIECLQPAENMSVYDPACGSGGFLLQAVGHLKRAGKNWKSLSLYGQEMNLSTWAVCKMNLFLHNVEDAQVLRGDTLRNPRHLVAEGAKTLRQFDRVFANPPFSLKSWGHDLWSKGDPFGRDVYGCPPKSYGDLAFVQHMIASLKPEGMLGVVLPHGILFRGGAEGKIRQKLLEQDLIEAVIGLAPNLFYGTGIPACVLLIHKNKPEQRRKKVLMVNGSDECIEGKNQNSLSDKNVERMAGAFLKFADEERFARVVGREEIEANDWNLNIARYVQTAEAEGEIDVAAEVKKLKELQKERNQVEARMMMLVDELGYDRT